MFVRELNHKQMASLKEALLLEQYDTGITAFGLAELVNADELISDEEVCEYFAGFAFSESDFW